MLGSGKVALESSQAVLRRDAPTQVERIPEDLRRGPAHQRALLVAEEDRRVQVAVAGVAESADLQPRLGGEPPQPPDHLGNAAYGNRHILGKVVVRHRHQDLSKAATGLPEPVPLGARLGHAVVDAVQEVDDSHQVVLHVLLVIAVLLDQQHSFEVGVEAWRQQWAHHPERGPVHELQCGGEMARRKNPRNSAGGVVDACEPDQRRRSVAGQWDELDDHLGHDPEGAFGADEELGQAVPGGALAQLAAQAQHLAVGEDDRQPDHVIGRDAVLEAAQSA